MLFPFKVPILCKHKPVKILLQTQTRIQVALKEEFKVKRLLPQFGKTADMKEQPQKAKLEQNILAKTKYLEENQYQSDHEN